MKKTKVKDIDRDQLLRDAIEVIKSHLADETALDWTSNTYITEMRRIVEEYEQRR